METRPYKPFSFGDCVDIERIGLIKINRRNYEALKESSHPQVDYNAAMDVLMVDNNLVVIDDELTDDIAKHQPSSLPKLPEEITLFSPAISHLGPSPSRPVEVRYLFNLI